MCKTFSEEAKIFRKNSCEIQQTADNKHCPLILLGVRQMITAEHVIAVENCDNSHKGISRN